MMGPEKDDGQGAHFYPGNEMESVVLDSSPHAFISNDKYKSTISAKEYLDPLSVNKYNEEEDEDVFQISSGGSFSKSPKELASNVGREDPLIEPPSYADVIFTPYETVGEGSNGSFKDLSSRSFPFSSSSSVSFPDHLIITASDPQKIQDTTNTSIVPGSNTYITYLIVTHTDIPQYGGGEFSVRRRFRDVVTLGDRLAEAYRGYFIPSRPEKSIVESQVMQKQDFIEQRRLALEKYLRRLANHPIIRRSDELRLFLQSQGKLPLVPTTDMASRMLDGAASLPRQLFGEGSVVMSPKDVVQPAKGGRDLVRMFKELKQSVTIEWGGSKPAVNEDDKEFLERKEKLEDLEQYLSEASQQAEILVKAQQEVGETMGELGLAFIKLAKFESENAIYNTQRTHAVDAKRLATAAVKVSRFYRESNAQSVRHLDQLHEYLSAMQSVHTAFNDRSNALLTVQTLLTEVSSIITRIDKLEVASSKIFGGDKSRTRKIEDLKAALGTTEEARDTAITEYERIKDINHSELGRFDAQRKADFLEMLKGFVHNQVGYAEKIANVWHNMAEECKPSLPQSPVLVSPRS